MLGVLFVWLWMNTASCLYKYLSTRDFIKSPALSAWPVVLSLHLTDRADNRCDHSVWRWILMWPELSCVNTHWSIFIKPILHTAGSHCYGISAGLPCDTCQGVSKWRSNSCTTSHKKKKNSDGFGGLQKRGPHEELKCDMHLFNLKNKHCLFCIRRCRPVGHSCLAPLPPTLCQYHSHITPVRMMNSLYSVWTNSKLTVKVSSSLHYMFLNEVRCRKKATLLHLETQFPHLGFSFMWPVELA